MIIEPTSKGLTSFPDVLNPTCVNYINALWDFTEYRLPVVLLQN